jgi:hypothetical protein
VAFLYYFVAIIVLLLVAKMWLRLCVGSNQGVKENEWGWTMGEQN